MLLISRKYQEKVVITNKETGEQIVVTAIRGNIRSCCIGIDADPNKYHIVRQEIQDTTKKG